MTSIGAILNTAEPIRHITKEGAIPWGIEGRKYMTEHKAQLKEELAALRRRIAQLETTLQERMGEITTQQQREAALRQSKEAAEAASRTKSEFLATLSHELRSPLGVILGYIPLLLDNTFGHLTDEQTDILHRIDRNAQELFNLITSVLDFSRLEADRLPVKIKEVQLPQFFEDLQDEVRHEQEASQLNFIWCLEEELPLLHTDLGKLKVILKNLIRNAIKFTSTGNVTVTVGGEVNGIIFSVADTGVGIAPEAFALIFEPFHQLETLQGPQQSGTGLGLYIVKRLVSVLGGTVTVESEVGRGSTFRIWIPYKQRI